MSESFICKSLQSQLEEIVRSGQVSDTQLQSMLTCKKNYEFDFTLVDIREIFEYSDASIVGCDMLLPTSTIHQHMDKLENIKETFIVLYCRTGNRTDQMLFILKRMGFKKIAHLSEGIVDYSGEIAKNAPLPNEIG